MAERKVVHTHHVLAVKDLAVSAAYFKDKLGFELSFTAQPGWAMLLPGERVYARSTVPKQRSDQGWGFPQARLTLTWLGFTPA